MGTWTEEGFVGNYDAYHVVADTGQRFFVSMRLEVGPRRCRRGCWVRCRLENLSYLRSRASFIGNSYLAKNNLHVSITHCVQVVFTTCWWVHWRKFKVHWNHKVLTRSSIWNWTGPTVNVTENSEKHNDGGECEHRELLWPQKPPRSKRGSICKEDSFSDLRSKK